MTRVSVKEDDVVKANRKLPRALVPFFFFSYFIFGVDFGFALHLDPKYRLVSKIISTAISLIMIALMLTPGSYTFGFFWVFYVCEYISYFIICKTVRYSPCKFLLDVCLPNGQVINLSRAVIAYTFLTMICKIILGSIRCLDSSIRYRCNFSSSMLYFIRTSPVLSIDLISVALSIIFQYTRLKLRNLRRKLKDSNISPNNFLQEYMKLADRYDKIKPFLNRIVITSLVIRIPKLMTLLWYTLRDAKNGDLSWSSYIRSVWLPMHIALQLCLPAFVAETINTEIDAIKVVLSEKIGTEKDEKHIKMKFMHQNVVTEEISHYKEDTQIDEAERVLQYLDHRRLRHEIFRFVPLDVRLAISLFELCSTYFIVILQFTHLYD